MPNEILTPLQSLISCFLTPPQTGERHWAQLRESGEATAHVPKVLPAEPQQLLHKLMGVLLSLLFSVPRIRPVKTVSTGHKFNRFSSRLWRGSLVTFFPLVFLPVLQLSLPRLKPDQIPGCLASGPDEAQALMSHCKNSVRDKAIGKR